MTVSILLNNGFILLLYSLKLTGYAVIDVSWSFPHLKNNFFAACNIILTLRSTVKFKLIDETGVVLQAQYN